MDGSREAAGVSLLLEEHREAIATAWRRVVEGGNPEPALAFAVAPLLREMSLVLRRAMPSQSGGGDSWTRCAVLVRSSAGPAQVAREFRVLRRVIWDVLRADGHLILPDERRAVDEWLDEALERSLERTERARMRVEVLGRAPVVVPPKLPARSRPSPPASAHTALAGTRGWAAARPPPSAGRLGPALPVAADEEELPLVEADLVGQD